jgi:RNA-directed DNA polymerase
MTTNKPKKKQKLRNNEYYSIQNQFDTLYEKSKSNTVFKDLMPLIISEQNIMLAYRNIKKNSGSHTRGVNSSTIVNLGEKEPQKLVDYVIHRLENFTPHAVRRVEIPKPDGRTRPLGIPTIEDRLIQQCIKQVLEPICEAKFYSHSYGFRPNRSTHHAIARAMFLVNLNDYHFVVDVDIKGFFDNVNHGKLLKQLWTLGIQDKELLSIISKSLKAPIKGIWIPDRGIPQGGLVSPLYANVVLNELDWWIASQWDTFPSRKRYLSRPNYKGNGTLKKIYIVRYADDFKIFCKTRSEADKVFIAVKRWLKERLMLDISPEKSKVVNLKKNYSNFLGFKLKLRKKSGKWILKSHMADKAKDNCKSKIREAIAQIRKEPNQWSVMRFNATILGLHNYFKIATNVYVDFDRIAFDVRKTLLCRTKTHRTKTGSKSKAFQNFYGEFTGKVFYVEKMALYPVNGVKTSPPMCFTQSICNYTQEGRRKIHEMQKSVSPQILQYLMGNPIKGRSVELNDNRISMYVAQRGKCAITHEPLETKDMEVHHITPIELGGKDNYENLVLVTYTVHKLIHATTPEAIEKYKEMLNNVDVNWTRLNKLRLLAGNCKI